MDNLDLGKKNWIKWKMILTSLKKANMFLQIPITFFPNHFNGKTRLRKQGTQGVLTNEEDKMLMA